MFERAIFRSFCRSLRRILFASVVLVFGGICNTWAYTVTYSCSGNTWSANNPNSIVAFNSIPSGCTSGCAHYSWYCCYNGNSCTIFELGSTLNLTGDMTCSLQGTPVIQQNFMGVTYYAGNCANPSNPMQETPYINDSVSNAYATYTIKSPSNLSSQSLANLYSGLGNCVQFLGYYDGSSSPVSSTTYSCNGSDCGSFIPINSNIKWTAPQQLPGMGECVQTGWSPLYMRCSWTEYNVIYHGCDGTTASGGTVIYNGSFNVLSYAATNLSSTGYTFQSWNTAADGSGTSYAPGTSFTMNNCAVSGTTVDLYAVCTCNTADNYWWNADNTACVQGYTITLQILPAYNTPAPTYSTQPTTLYTIPTRGAYLDADRTLLMTKTANPIKLPYLEIMLDFDTNAPINPVDDAQYFVSNVNSINLSASYHCFAHPNIAGGIYQGHGYTNDTCFIHKNPENYTTTTISGLTPENRDGYLTDAGIYEAENQYRDQTWFITGKQLDSSPSVASPTLTGYTFVNWCTDTAGTTSCFKGQVPNNAQAGTYYAHWTANHYSVTYNPGAHATSGSTSYTDSYDSDLGTGGATYDSPYSPLDFDTAPISDNMSADTGYVFVGWTTDAPANQTITNGVVANQYTGDTYWKRTSALQLYAAYDCNTSNGYSWNTEHTQCINGYTVTFLPGDSNNDGTGTAATGSTASITGRHMGDTITLPQSAFTAPTGYEFDKWDCDNGIGDKNVEDTFPMPAADVTCTAQWDCASGYYMNNNQCVPGYTITLNCGSGGCDQPATPSTLYTIYGQGAYLDAARTDLMTESGNLVELPTRNPYVVSYDTNEPTNSKTNQPYSVSAVSPSSITFQCTGFEGGANYNEFIAASGNDNAYGHITAQGITAAANLNGNTSWNATWLTTIPSIQPGPLLLGYVFNGWYDNVAGNGNPVNNITTSTPSPLYAKWTPITYFIQYDLAGGTHGANYPTSATYNTEFNVSNPTRNGFTFMGWNITGMSNNDNDDIHYIGNSTITGSSTSTSETSFMNLSSTLTAIVKFTATWSSNTYNITYNNVEPTDNWTGDHPSTYTAGSNTPIGTPSRTNYDFQGWCVGLNNDNCQNPTLAYTITAGTVGDVVLYAQWDCAANYEWNNNNECIPIQWPITYYDTNCTTVLNGLNPATYDVTQTVTLPSEPAAPTGYHNNGWCDTCNGCQAYVSFTGWTAGIKTGPQNVYLKPRLPNKYSITYNANGHGSYTGAYTDQTNTFGPGAESGGGTYDATWSTKSLSDAHISENTGYTFCGWSESSSDTCSSGTILTANAPQGTWQRTTDLTLYAIYSANTYTITYNNVNNATWGSGQNHPETYTYGTSVTIGNPTWTSYSFLGWCVGGDDCPSPVSPYVIAATDTGNLVLYAQWDCANGYHMVGNACVNTYTVTYEENAPSGETVTGMPSPNPVTVTAGDYYGLASPPTATNHNFQKWDCYDSNGDVVEQLGGSAQVHSSQIVMPSSNVTCIADWGEASTVSLLWNTNGGTGDLSQFSTSCTYGTTGTIGIGTNPTQSGYSFKGWLVSNWHCVVPDLDPNAIGGTSVYYAYVDSGGTKHPDEVALGLTQRETWAVQFPYGTVKGVYSCSSLNTGTEPGVSGTGSNCWCKITGFMPNGGEMCETDDYQWVFVYNLGNYCNGDCGFACVTVARSTSSSQVHVDLLTKIQ